LWHAQRETTAFAVPPPPPPPPGGPAKAREGKPIMSKEASVLDWLGTAVEVWVTGGVVAARKSSRKCCSCRATA
jgi:hypothetical protein